MTYCAHHRPSVRQFVSPPARTPIFNVCLRTIVAALICFYVSVEGYCRGIPAGDVNVAWNVGDVANGERWDQSNYNTGNSWTGWVATVRIIVEEVDVESADTVIV